MDSYIFQRGGEKPPTSIIQYIIYVYTIHMIYIYIYIKQHIPINKPLFVDPSIRIDVSLPRICNTFLHKRKAGCVPTWRRCGVVVLGENLYEFMWSASKFHRSSEVLEYDISFKLKIPCNNLYLHHTNQCYHSNKKRKLFVYVCDSV